MKKLIFFAAITSMSLSACGPDFFYQSEKEIADGGRWMYRDTVDFAFTVRDTAALYNMFLDVTYADSFPNQNLYLKLYTRFPDGQRISKPYSFDLFNALGDSNGDCSGHRCKLRSVLQQHAFFNQPGEYVITLEQFMRRDSLPGVVAVGLALEKTDGTKQ